ncbi:MAG: hypothetical protein ACTHKL_20535 [Streptosporangiaceae bacterium]
MRGHTEAGSDDAVQAADQSQNPWQAMRADLAAKMRDLHDRIERKQEAKADVADDDAIFAEEALWKRWTTPPGRSGRPN